MKFFWIVLFFSVQGSQVWADITPSDLLAGDLIFSLNSLGAVEHVAVYAGIKDQRRTIIHAVSGRYNSIMRTLLKPIQIGQRPYQVYRNKNFRLAGSVKHRMGVWSEQVIPYDAKAADFVTKMDESLDFWDPSMRSGTSRLLEYSKEMSKINFYRRIKFAARRNNPIYPERVEKGKSGKGLRCAEAVILAYQIEELTSFLKPLEKFKDFGWISDKHSVPRDVASQFSVGYCSYQERLCQAQEYKVVNEFKNERRKELSFQPSWVAWDFEKAGPIEDFINHFDSVFNLDAKISNAAVLYLYLQEDGDHWSSLGQLNEVEPLVLTEEEKKKWPLDVDYLFQEADRAKAALAERIRAASGDVGLEVPFSPRTVGDYHFQRRASTDSPVLPPLPTRQLELEFRRSTSIHGTPPRPVSRKSMSEDSDSVPDGGGKSPHALSRRLIFPLENK